jgi:hypothetical protein
VALRLIHTHDDSIDLQYADVHLLRYVYAPQMDPAESPKPYFHPLRTLAGNEVTIYRPYDHVWHKGLAMTQAVLSGQNFWGGPSDVRGRGYVQLPNNGSMRHRAWEDVRAAGETATLVERLDWVSYEGQRWIDETRRIEVGGIDDAARSWTLTCRFTLRNVRSAPLVFGSPTTEGRPLAGYGGLFWRGPRSFLKGKVQAARDLEGPDVMGKAAPWLAYTGRHDGNAATSTLVFLDHPTNPRYPTTWFIRNDPYAAVSFAFAFDEELVLPPGDILSLAYRIVLADGALDRAQIEAHAQDFRAG